MFEKELNYEYVETKFQEYLNNYDQNNKKIKLKIRHSYEVARLAEQLAKSLYFTKEEVVLAKIIGLLHDIGRFEQIKQTDSFKDDKLDHAELAINYLFKKEMHITEFIDDRFYDDIIRNAIYYHNKYDIPTDKGPIITKFMKLIRDVDKIAIFYSMATSYELSFRGEISDEVMTSFNQEKLIRKSDIKTGSDSILEVLAFIFDLNYEESFDLLAETDYLGIFIGSVEVSKELEETWNEVRQRVYDKLERGI